MELHERVLELILGERPREFPPDASCWRGGGLPDKHRDWYDAYGEELGSGPSRPDCEFRIVRGRDMAAVAFSRLFQPQSPMLQSPMQAPR